MTPLCVPVFVLEILLYGRLGLLCFSVHLGCLIIILAACTGAPSFPSTVCLCCLCAQIGARLTDGRTVALVCTTFNSGWRFEGSVHCESTESLQWQCQTKVAGLCR